MEKTKGLDQSFTVKNFQRLLKRTDFHGENGYRSIDQLLPRLTSLEESISNSHFQFSPFQRGKINGFQYISAGSLENRLLMRKLDDNVKRIFRIKSSNRNSIVWLTKYLAEEKTKFYVLKLDLKSFYESIPHAEVIKKIQENNLLSNGSKTLLTKYLDTIASHSQGGLPRGICLSSTLSEYYMQPIDKRIKEIDGIYYYGRFVDDIVIFCYRNPRDIYNQIKKIIKLPLSLNSAKTRIMSSEKNDGYNDIDFDFLGYRFRKNEQLEVDIAKKKNK
ncbi:antiviral reverse transcriptase Drt3a [Cellvibrio fontiphilus]|uniref:Antiviral reverse transcriptase Drt3a n=1 Tax=Cellvibrio fontiphilus TaxID=1815559 RepID=A0ABV7FG24_9GAMM